MQQLTTGTLARRGRVNLETVRYYERQGLLPRPPRLPSGYRVFPEDAVRRIHFIKRAQQLGFSLQEIKDLLGLRVNPRTTCADVRRRAEAKIGDIDEKVRALEAMKKALEKLVAACAGRGPAGECPILESLEGKRVFRMTAVELVYDNGCPNVALARANLIRAFEQAGLSQRWTEWERSSPNTPQRVRGFPSPTVLVGGRDVAGFEPAGELASCRLYSLPGGRFTGVPPVELIAAALKQATPAWKQSLLVLPGAAVALLPNVACPACWPVYAGLLSSLGLGFLLSTRYLLPLTIAFLALALGALGLQARRHHKYGPLLLGLAGSAPLLAGKFVFDSNPAMFGGLGVLIAASIWNSWPRRAAPPVSCPVCEEKSS